MPTSLLGGFRSLPRASFTSLVCLPVTYTVLVTLRIYIRHPGHMGREWLRDFAKGAGKTTGVLPAVDRAGSKSPSTAHSRHRLDNDVLSADKIRALCMASNRHTYPAQTPSPILLAPCSLCSPAVQTGPPAHTPWRKTRVVTTASD